MTARTVPAPGRPGTRRSQFGLFAARLMGRVSVAVYRASGGRLAGSFLGTPVLVLDHIGRRTERRRSTPLHYIRRGDDFIVVGSRAGSDTPPDWFLNLQAHPQTRVQVGGRRVGVTAKEAHGPLRESLWTALVRQVPAFAVYQQRTTRQLPVVLLTPNVAAEKRGAAAPSMPNVVAAWCMHLAALGSPIAITALRASREENEQLRIQRLRTAATERIAQRRNPDRPRMQTLSVSPGGTFSWRTTAAPPPPRSLAAIVRPLAVATCDLDRPLALGRTPFPLPLHFGHECVAEVVAVGDEVSTIEVGERVVVPFQISCGTCDRCTIGLTANCACVPPISMYGFGVGGGHWGGVVADQIAVPFADGMLVPLPADLDPVAAASVADNVSDAYRLISPHLPSLIEAGRRTSAIVVGPGSPRSRIGGSVPLYAALIARAFGADVTLVDARPAVHAAGAALGLTVVTPQQRRDLDLAPLVVDVSGSPAGLRSAIMLTDRDGICSSAGALHAATRLPTGLMYARNVTVHITRAHARTVIPEVLELMSSDRLCPELVTTVVADFEDAPAVLHDFAVGDSIKTILTRL